MTGDKLRVELEQLRSAAANWVTLSEGLSAGVAPHVPSSGWPSAVATGALHTAATSVNEQYAARIAATAGGVNGAADNFSHNDEGSAKEIGSILQSVTQPIGQVAGQAMTAGGQALGQFGQVAGQATSGLFNMIGSLGQSSLGHEHIDMHDINHHDQSWHDHAGDMIDQWKGEGSDHDSQPIADK